MNEEKVKEYYKRFKPFFELPYGYFRAGFKDFNRYGLYTTIATIETYCRKSTNYSETVYRFIDHKAGICFYTKDKTIFDFADKVKKLEFKENNFLCYSDEDFQNYIELCMVGV